MAAVREVGIDASFERDEMELLEPRDLHLRERLVDEVRERRPAPEEKSISQEPGSRVCVVGIKRLSSLGQKPFEALGVELTRLDPDEIARRPRYEPVAQRRFAETRDGCLECVRPLRRAFLAPELVEQTIPRDDLVCPEKQECEQAALAQATERDGKIPVVDLHRPEESEIHSGSLSASCQRPQAFWLV